MLVKILVVCSGNILNMFCDFCLAGFGTFLQSLRYQGVRYHDGDGGDVMVMEMVMIVLGGWKPKLMLADASAGAEGASSMREIVIVSKSRMRQSNNDEKLLGLVPVGATTTHGSVPVT